jgi:2-polyprenyl-6-methoxyphenol hydroxylase-like FAD-dependent oxidoreductase
MGLRDRDRVVVLGASMAGLLAARVLSTHFAEVLLVDRDRVVSVGTPRRGVPHGRHAHGLVARGHQILEQLFPRLTEDVVAAGVGFGDFNNDIQWLFDGKRIAPSPSGLGCLAAPRPVLEERVRVRVQAIRNVKFLEEHDITGLRTTPDGTRVLGARVQRRGSAAEEVLDADLVVDTTGRGSRTPAWLEALGYRRPDEERIKIDLAYTTRQYRLRHDPFGGDLAVIPAATPRHPRGALFFPVPGGPGRAAVSLTGILGDHPPVDPDGFLDFAKSLPIKDIYDALKDAEPLDDPVMFKYPASTRRHYERLSDFPAGLLVMGDAVCTFNPVYAQGMTVSALESLVLSRHVEAEGEVEARPYFRDISREIDAPWELAAGSDLGYTGVEGKRSMKVRMVNSYVARLQNAAVHDPVLANAFIRVAGLIDPPVSLLAPRNAIRVLRGPRPASRPAENGRATRQARHPAG